MKPLHWDAINPSTGQPFTWDDPNLRWGDPAYYLEPGDPGFVSCPVPPAAQCGPPPGSALFLCPLPALELLTCSSSDLLNRPLWTANKKVYDKWVTFREKSR